MKMKFRLAHKGDIQKLVELLADDELGMHREDTSSPLNERYIEAFDRIDSDPNNELIVAESNSDLIGMLQLTYIPYLTHRGSRRCLVEGVRISKEHRGKGLGKTFFEWVINRARERGCRIVQLTSDKQRPNALRFYESLGFKATHEGFKLKIENAN